MVDWLAKPLLMVSGNFSGKYMKCAGPSVIDQDAGGRCAVECRFCMDSHHLSQNAH